MCLIKKINAKVLSISSPSLQVLISSLNKSCFNAHHIHNINLLTASPLSTYV